MSNPANEADRLATEAGIYKLPEGAQRAAAEALLEQHPHLRGKVAWNDRHIWIDGREYRNPDYGFTRAGCRALGGALSEPYAEELAFCSRVE